MAPMSGLLALLACSEPVVLDSDPAAPPDDEAPDSAADPDRPENIGGDSDTGPDSPAPETWPQACDAIYDPDTVPRFDLEFSAEEWEGMRSDCSAGIQRYRPVQFSWEGETVSAQARLKGNWSWSCDKFQFVISFNEEDPDARFRGLRKLMLDAAWYDQTLLHERLAFPLFAAQGLPHSCVNNATLWIDGAYYGLYTNLEHLDREYLERNYEEPDGNLYQAASELKTNEEEGDTSRLVALWQASTVAEIEALVNLDQAVAVWAVEAMIPALDNYWAGVDINYYVYDHPSRGFEWIPYDLDIAFGDSAYPGGSLVWGEGVEAFDPILWEHSGWGKEQLLMTVLADEGWCTRFVEALDAARAGYEPEQLEARVDRWSAQTAEAMAADRNRSFSEEDNALALSRLRPFFQARADHVDAWLAEGGHCPARW